MITPSVMQGLTNENTMLSSVSIEDLEEYKKNACKILRSQTQCATAKIVEELIDQEIMNRRIIEEWNKNLWKISWICWNVGGDTNRIRE